MKGAKSHMNEMDLHAAPLKANERPSRFLLLLRHEPIEEEIA